MLTPVFPSTPWGAWGKPRRDRFDDGPLSDEDARRRLWVVVSHEAVKGPGAGTEWRPAALERTSCRADERRFHLVRVIRYESGPCAAGVLNTGPTAAWVRFELTKGLPPWRFSRPLP